MRAGLSILIADKRASAEEAARLIERWGHCVKHAHDGFVAVEEARRSQPNLMLLGLSLPGLNGYCIANRLRKLPSLNQMRLTALLDEPAGFRRADLKKAGFTDTLVRPIAPIELLILIIKTREALQRAESLPRSARVIATPEKRRGVLLSQGVEKRKTATAASHESFCCSLQAGDDESSSALELLEMLIAGDCLDADHRAVACKVLSVGERSLFAWEASFYARIRQRFLSPVCKLCRYHVPAAEVPASWTNGGYCCVCAEALR